MYGEKILLACSPVHLVQSASIGTWGKNVPNENKYKWSAETDTIKVKHKHTSKTHIFKKNLSKALPELSAFEIICLPSCKELIVWLL